MKGKGPALKFGIPLAALTIFFLVLPETSLQDFTPADSRPFRWDRSDLFSSLQQEFESIRSGSAVEAAVETADLLTRGREISKGIREGGDDIPFDLLTRLETVQFRAAAIAAAFPALLPDVSAFIRQVRITVMPAARSWPQGRKDVLEAVYRIIYGGRAALEEALIQNSSDAVPPLTLIEDASGSGPSVVINGVRVHSGDIVLSRGGAPTSALIARGNDFPGNFSHAALVHVDPDSGKAVAVESLIERGAVVSSLEDYLEEKRLRILLLRLRPDHPVVGDDPLAIHRAATDMLHLVRNGGIGYDFSMNWEDPGRFFCSEVPYHAYRSLGIDLWAHRSRISSPGLAEWLGGMGVRHFTTIIPSDIEYDPRLAAVAEWRNPETLRQDRFDNVVIDALLAGAEEGDRLDYPFYRLPLARLIKGWSYLQWKAGFVPLIPEGMTPGSALRVNALVEKVHPALKEKVEAAGRKYKEAKGYEPPYWDLLDLAKEVLSETRPALTPYLSRSH